VVPIVAVDQLDLRGCQVRGSSNDIQLLELDSLLSGGSEVGITDQHVVEG
jgi:hypothetical protein